MTLYCIDSNILIEAYKGPYGFDLFPVFWEWIEEKANEEKLFCSKVVYDEIYRGSDELAEWVHERRNSPLFRDISEEVQIEYVEIVNYVQNHQRFSQQQKDFFLGEGDPFIIAHAKVENAIVVTQEALVPHNSSKVKIPNICNQFGVSYYHNRYSTQKMMRELGAQFS